MTVINLTKFDACSKALLAMLGDHITVQRWWASPNRAFGGKTPWEQYRQDQQQVANYILQQLVR